jgi:FkbM family methyltransferase
MKTLYERTLGDGRGAADVLLAATKRDGMTLNFVDVGARNGSFILPPAYSACCRLVGFEPNEAEYQKLVAGDTDAKRAGLQEPPFRDRAYFPVALWREAAELDLTIPRGAGAVTLMGPAHVDMTLNLWREFDRGMTYYEKIQAPVKTLPVTCDSLDRLWANDPGLIDVLKIDVEGAECAVLEGAASLLQDRRILLIRSEFLLTPYYREHVLLGHQQVFLDRLGYRLVALDVDHAPYCWKRTAIPQDLDRRFQYAGDAYYIVDPDLVALDDERRYRLGLACIAFGFNATGLNLIRESNFLDEADIVALEAVMAKKGLGRRLREAWDAIPHLAYRMLPARR